MKISKLYKTIKMMIRLQVYKNQRTKCKFDKKKLKEYTKIFKKHGSLCYLYQTQKPDAINTTLKLNLD